MTQHQQKLQKLFGGNILNGKLARFVVANIYIPAICLHHRHLSNIGCLKARTACLVCFIGTVNGHSKKKKRSLDRLALVAGA
jgi:hypothetical protein